MDVILGSNAEKGGKQESAILGNQVSEAGGK
jgi:hypothetical protein